MEKQEQEKKDQIQREKLRRAAGKDMSQAKQKYSGLNSESSLGYFFTLVSVYPYLYTYLWYQFIILKDNSVRSVHSEQLRLRSRLFPLT